MENKNQLPEAPISLNTRIKSPNGFEHQLTLRHGLTNQDFNNFMTLVAEKEKTLLEKGWTPIAQGFQNAKAPAVTKACLVHPEAMMSQKISKKSGKPYFSHSKGIYPNLTMCFGSGWQEDDLQQGGGF